MRASLCSPRHVRLESCRARPPAKQQEQQQRIKQSSELLARRRLRRMPTIVVCSSSRPPGLDDGDGKDDDDDYEFQGGENVTFRLDPIAEGNNKEGEEDSPPEFTTASPFPPRQSSSRGNSNKLPSVLDDLEGLRAAAAGAAAGVASAARAVSHAVELLLAFFGRRPAWKLEVSVGSASSGGGSGGRHNSRLLEGPELIAVLPRPREVARLTAAVVAASLVLLAVVLLCDEVGRRLITETVASAAAAAAKK